MAGSSRRRRSSNRRIGSQGTTWFGVNPWIIIGGAVALVLILLFVPMFPATKVVEVTDTKMVTVQQQIPETVTEDVPTKVYVGYMQERGQGYGGYMPPIIIVTTPGYGGTGDTGGVGASADTGTYGGSADYGPSYGPSYGPYDNSGRRYQVDVSDEIVDFQQANGPDRTLTITLTNASGKSTVYRYIDRYDLTKTGETNIRTTVTRTKTVTTQEPKQVTTLEAVPIRVNLIHLITGAVNSGTRTTVVQFLKQLNDAGNNFSDSLNSPELSAKMNSQDPNTLLSGIKDARQQINILESQIEDLTPSSKVPELAELKYSALKTASTLDSLFDDLSTAIQTGNLAQLQQLQTKVSELDKNPDSLKLEQLQRSLQLKYNITDNEIDATPSADVTEHLGYVPSPAPPPSPTPSPAPTPPPAPTPTPALSSMYDGTYKGTFNYKYRKTPIHNDTDPWIKVTLGVTLDLRTRDINNGQVTLDVTRILCSDWGFDALNGISPMNNSNAVLPANPPNEGPIDCTMAVNFPNGAQLNIYSGKSVENYINWYGKSLYGSKWDAHNVAFPLSQVGCQIEFGWWELVKQTGPDVWG